MRMRQQNYELVRLARAKALVSLASRAPRGIRFRLAKLLYDYNSPRNRGIELVVPYLDDLGLALRLQINTREFICWQVFFLGEYEPESIALIQQVIQPGDIVVEAGANIGTETLLLAQQVGCSGRVYAFEPVPHIADWLHLNVLHNHLSDRVSIVRFSLGENTASVTFHLAPRSFTNQGMSSKLPFRGATEQLDVRQVTLDAWCSLNDIQRLDFLKMDIQGAEIDLLRGGVQTLQTYRPMVYTEACSSQLSLKELWRTLRDLNYRVFRVLPGNRLVSLADENKLVGGNWLALHILDDRTGLFCDGEAQR
jgi:FkbM family methyltransferase